MSSTSQHCNTDRQCDGSDAGFAKRISSRHHLLLFVVRMSLYYLPIGCPCSQRPNHEARAERDDVRTPSWPKLGRELTEWAIRANSVGLEVTNSIYTRLARAVCFNGAGVVTNRPYLVQYLGCFWRHQGQKWGGRLSLDRISPIQLHRPW